VWETNLKFQKIMKNKWQKLNYHLLFGEVPLAVPRYLLNFFKK
jgi:hypothetical protein